MSIEFYAKQPPKLEVFALPGGDTDIILRRKITEIPQEDDDGDPNASCWQCEEIQIRQQGKITFSEVEERFDLLWGEETDPKTAKISEMSVACNDAIVSGVDVVLSDGNTHHFSLSIEDQLNLISLQGMVSSGAEAVPYHADGEECCYYSADDFTAIATAATEWKLYQESYFNSLRAYIQSMETMEELLAVEYGMKVPLEYQTDVLRQIMSQMGGS